MDRNIGDPEADAVLKYIRHFLMEEDLDDQSCVSRDSALQAAERSLQDILADKCTSSIRIAPPNQIPENPTSPFSSRIISGSNHLTSGQSCPEDANPDASCCERRPEKQFLGREVILDFISEKKGKRHNRSACFSSSEATQNVPVPGRIMRQKGHSRGSRSRKNENKNRISSAKELVDTRALLIQCAEAVASGDNVSANEVLAQIRQHSSPFGNASQRIAHWFGNAFQERMAGTGSQVCDTSLAIERVPTNYLFKACKQVFIASPFMDISNIFVTQTVMSLAKNASRIHIVHFGILYGLEWISLIEYLSTRPGGPPVLRITGIDIPQPGFRPGLEETGQHLASYCEKFSVPFEFSAISQQFWERIRIEDLKIERNEVIIVNSSYSFRHLLDETVVLNSQRDAALDLIGRINPDVFIHGIVNGAHNAPFFMSRFREALFYFSSVFDWLESNASVGDQERIAIERDVYGKEILNVIGCEGVERLERPETYKQWQVRNLRAGQRQLPLKEEIMRSVRDQVKSCCHKEFSVSEDGQWMLLGWKGRTLYALSCWKSA